MSTVLFWQPQRLCILGPGMCLSVLPASSYSRCCCSSVRFISTHSAYLFHTAELFILFSMADLGLWDKFPGCCLPHFFLFSLCSFYFWGCYSLNWSQLWWSSIFPNCWRNCICAAVWGRLLSAYTQTALQGNAHFVMMHFTAKKGRRVVHLQGAWSSENTGQSGQGHPGMKWNFNKTPPFL